jgi:hypothetical protein
MFSSPCAAENACVMAIALSLHVVGGVLRSSRRQPDFVSRNDGVCFLMYSSVVGVDRGLLDQVGFGG